MQVPEYKVAGPSPLETQAFQQAGQTGIGAVPGADAHTDTPGVYRLNGLNDSLDLGGCIGAECCSTGMKYDNTNHKCIENLNKTSNIKDSVKLNGNKI